MIDNKLCALSLIDSVISEGEVVISILTPFFASAFESLRTYLIEKINGKVLTLFGKFLVLDLQFVLQATEKPEFPAQLERRQNRIFTGKSYQRWTGERSVCIHPRPRMIQTILTRPASNNLVMIDFSFTTRVRKIQGLTINHRK